MATERIQGGNSFSNVTFISFGSLMESKKAARSHKRAGNRCKALRSGNFDLQSSAERSSKAGAALEGIIPDFGLVGVPLSDVGLVELHDQSV